MNLDSALLWTPAEAAESLRISPKTLWRKTKDGDIPCVRIGRSVRYSPGSLAAWVAENDTALPGLPA